MVDDEGDEVILEGGSRDGQPVSLSEMRHVAVGEYVLDDPQGEYRHFAESMAYFRQDQRIAIFEPAVAGEPELDE